MNISVAPSGDMFSPETSCPATHIDAGDDAARRQPDSISPDTGLCEIIMCLLRMSIDSHGQFLP